VKLNRNECNRGVAERRREEEKNANREGAKSAKEDAKIKLKMNFFVSSFALFAPLRSILFFVSSDLCVSAVAFRVCVFSSDEDESIQTGSAL
jgi:hypothetical protein